ncbi:MAG: endonuclease NucS domain-containing protein [Candidatus Binataceae bacterium]
MNQSAELSQLKIVYGYKRAALEYEAGQQNHDRILNYLAQAKSRALIAVSEVWLQPDGLELTAEGKQLLSKLQEFAMRRKIKVRFGSARYPYQSSPLQFLLVYRGDDLCQAFPCALEGGYVYPENFLEHFVAGEPWTLASRRRGRDRDHDRIVAYLIANPETIEPGLTFLGTEHPVSGISDELGFLDLLFRDRDGRSLIVEVKVKSSELDEGIGKLGRHRRLFGEMNHIEPSRIRRLLACPEIPEARTSELREADIEWCVVPAAVIVKAAS